MRSWKLEHSLIKMLETGDDRIKNVAVASLAKLTSNKELHDDVVLFNGIKLLVQLLNEGISDQRRYTALALNNLAANYRYLISQAGDVRLLCKLVSDGTKNEKTEAASALGTLARQDPVNCAVVAGHGGIAALVALSKCEGMKQTAAVHTLEVIDSSSDIVLLYRKKINKEHIEKHSIS